MSTTTQCPHCGTRFKASQFQLEAYHGMVRCGNCQTPFDAIENRVEEGQGPQLALPIMHEALPAEAIPLAAQPWPGEAPKPRQHGYESEIDYPELDVVRRLWPWYLAALALVLLFIGQSIYAFRVELAARFPATKPLLLTACEKLHCEIPLPQNVDLLSIESSEMEADPAQAGVISLNITLRNHASYVQAYPKLELTLTDISDTAIGRRTFPPSEYLKSPDEIVTGLPGNREHVIRLTLDAQSLPAVGYRLYLYY